MMLSTRLPVRMILTLVLLCLTSVASAQTGGSHVKVFFGECTDWWWHATYPGMVNHARSNALAQVTAYQTALQASLPAGSTVMALRSSETVTPILGQWSPAAFGAIVTQVWTFQVWVPGGPCPMCGGTLCPHLGCVCDIHLCPACFYY